MKIKNLYYSSKFSRSFKKLPRSLEKQIKDRFEIFHKDPFDTRLSTHKLKGKLKNYWSFSITDTHRVVFEFLSEDEAGLVDIGDHSIHQ